MIVGLDDTDIVGSPGTNQLARRIVSEVSAQWSCKRIVRHQLLDDPRVPYTSKNGSASIQLTLRNAGVSGSEQIDDAIAFKALRENCRRIMESWFVHGSDPGLCFLPGSCPSEILTWGIRCQNELVDREQAYDIAGRTGIQLESLGGTEDGVIGALAAVGLASTENDGRVIQLGEWPDDLKGQQPVSVLNQRGVHVYLLATGLHVGCGLVDIGKHLRPNMRAGHAVLHVRTVSSNPPGTYQAIKQH